MSKINELVKEVNDISRYLTIQVLHDSAGAAPEEKPLPVAPPVPKPVPSTGLNMDELLKGYK